MSHFSVIARLPALIRRQEFSTALDTLLAPYCEHENEGRSEKFFTFHDTGEEYREEYETGSSEMVTIDGEQLFYYGDRVAEIKKGIARELGLKTGDLLTSHESRDQIDAEFRKLYAVVDVPHRERWATFEAFMKGYHDEEPDDAGRFGYLRNENAKWDYWRIGGRWRGMLLVKRHTVVEGIEPRSRRELDLDGPRGSLLPSAGLAEVAWEWNFGGRPQDAARE